MFPITLFYNFFVSELSSLGLEHGGQLTRFPLGKRIRGATNVLSIHKDARNGALAGALKQDPLQYLATLVKVQLHSHKVDSLVRQQILDLSTVRAVRFGEYHDLIVLDEMLDDMDRVACLGHPAAAQLAFDRLLLLGLLLAVGADLAGQSREGGGGRCRACRGCGVGCFGRDGRYCRLLQIFGNCNGLGRTDVLGWIRFDVLMNIVCDGSGREDAGNEFVDVETHG